MKKLLFILLLASCKKHQVKPVTPIHYSVDSGYQPHDVPPASFYLKHPKS